jgi:hypothetical protein
VEEEAPLVGASELVQVCRLLNEAGAQFLVYGGIACLLHGYLRATRDLDLYVGDDPENVARALRALAAWGDGAARELRVEEVFDNVVVRICEGFILDLSCQVGGLSFPEAYRRRRILRILDTDVTVMCRQDLITTKRTFRDKDALDLLALRELTIPEPGRPAV